MKVLSSRVIRLFALAVLLILAQSINLNAQDSLLSYEHLSHPPDMKELMQWKETFIYEVKFGAFKLGEVKTEVIKDTTFQGHQVWWLQTIITSNSSIPFVGEEENHYNTFFVEGDNSPYTLLYWRDNVDEQEFNDERYRFDYENQKVYVSRQGEPADTLKLTELSSGGQLIFYYSRLFAGTDQKFRLPVYLESEKGYITATNSTKIHMREYAAFEKPVRTYLSEGDADIKGAFGFRGKYKAWYIADDLRIPAETHARVWLGNVKIRLIFYKKVPRNQ